MRFARTYIGIAAVLLIAMALLVPFETTTLPPAHVQIVDLERNPVPRLTVTQEWKDVTVEDIMHVDIADTDDNGFVSFPKRTVRSSLLKRFLTGGLRVATQGIHASVGSSGSISVHVNGSPGLRGWAGYNLDGNQWPAQIQLEP